MGILDCEVSSCFEIFLRFDRWMEIDLMKTIYINEGVSVGLKNNHVYIFTWQFIKDRLSVPLRRTACFSISRRVIWRSLACTRSMILSARPRNIDTGRRTLIWWSCWYFCGALNFFLVVHIQRDCINFDLTSCGISFGRCWRSRKI